MPSHLLSRLTAAVAALILVGGGALVVAPAASAAAKPNITFTSVTSPSQSDVTIEYRVNRKAKAIASRTCSYSDGTTTTPLPDCGVATRTTKEGTTFSKSLTALAPGTYTFTVSVVLTDRGRSTATTRSFAVTGPPSVTLSFVPSVGFPGSCDLTATVTGFPPSSSGSMAVSVQYPNGGGSFFDFTFTTDADGAFSTYLATYLIATEGDAVSNVSAISGSVSVSASAPVVC